MIISASRRTDIPAFYSEWFFNRIKDGFLYVRNPMNIHQISKIKLTPDVVDFIVFWTKDPEPMINRLEELKEYNFYFQFTLTAYENDIEINVPSKHEKIIPAFKKLSERIGKERIIWRYDPILLNDKYTINFHLEKFYTLAEELKDYTEKCTISFIDMYKKTERNLQSCKIKTLTSKNIDFLAQNMSIIAKACNLQLETCSEFINLDKYEIKHAHCVDSALMERLMNCQFSVDKDRNQRKECGCVESIDIGAYNTCKNGCLYCYANFNQGLVEDNFSKHNVNSPLLFGEINPYEDKITERKMKSIIDNRKTSSGQLKFEF